MRAPLLGLVAMLAVGCVDTGPGPQPKKIEPGFVPQHLLQAVPAGITRLDVSIGGKVIYLGNKVEITRVAPGGTVKITHYWKVLQEVGASWRVFGLVHGDPTTADFINLPASDMQVAHGPATWRPGEIIEDAQEIVLRPDWKSASATVLVGLIEVGAHGVGDRMEAIGPNTKDRAVVARVLEVDLAKAPPPPGTINVPHAAGPITIDGVANDPGWSTAVTSPELATAEGSQDPVGKAIAKLTWDEQYLYVFVTITDTDIVNQYKKHDDPMWKEDCVELFIDADANRHGYVELQVNPNNVTFDKWWATTRNVEGDTTWESGMLTAVKLRGTTDQGDSDQGWDAEIAIPWDAVKGRDTEMKVNLPPHVGDRWRINLVRVDKKSGDAGLEAASWNRISVSDFHALDRMLTAVFADTTGAVTPGMPAVPGATPGAGEGSASPGASPGVSNGSAAGTGSAATAPAGAGSDDLTRKRMPSPGPGSAATLQLDRMHGATAGSAAPKPDTQSPMTGSATPPSRSAPPPSRGTVPTTGDAPPTTGGTAPSKMPAAPGTATTIPRGGAEVERKPAPVLHAGSASSAGSASTAGSAAH